MNGVLTLQVLQTAHRLTGALQEFLLRLTGFQPNRWTNGNATQQRNREKLASRQDAVHIVEINRYQFQVRTLLTQIVQATLEFPHLFVRVSRSLRENDDRIL